MSFNQFDVEQIAERTRRHELLAPFGELLLAYLQIVNSHSDGWAYWPPAHSSAKRFIGLLEAMSSPFSDRRIDVDIDALRKALGPMKTLLTRKGLPALNTSALPPTDRRR